MTVDRRRALLLVGGVAVGAPAFAQSTRRKPKVPPGRDPGGVAVAVLADAVDYTDPGIAGRLARDGEGEIIAWDLTDADRRPYGPTDPRLSRLLALGGPARIIVCRIEAGDPYRVAKFAAFAVQTPARIVVLWDAAPARADWPTLLDGTRRFTDRIFVVPVSEDRLPASQRGLMLAPPGQSETVTDDAVNALAVTAAAVWASEPQLTAAHVKERVSALCAARCPAQPR